MTRSPKDARRRPLVGLPATVNVGGEVLPMFDDEPPELPPGVLAPRELDYRATPPNPPDRRAPAKALRGS